MNAMSDIVVIGSTNTDMSIQTEILPGVGDIVSGGMFRMCPGGKGAIQAIGAARMGGTVSLVTMTGNDLFGRQAKQMFLTEGIDTDYIFSDPNNPSGVALIMMNSEGDKYISIAQGSITSLSCKEIDRCRTVLRGAKILLMELETPLPTAIYAARIAREVEAIVVINPSPLQELPDEIFKLANIIVPSRSEAKRITGIQVVDFATARKAAEVIASRGTKNIVVTLGQQGALLYEDGEVTEYEAIPVETKDASAAGDVFCSSMCVLLAEGKSLKQAVEFAMKSSAMCVTRNGTIDAIPYRFEVENWDSAQTE